MTTDPNHGWQIDTKAINEYLILLFVASVPLIALAANKNQLALASFVVGANYALRSLIQWLGGKIVSVVSVLIGAFLAYIVTGGPEAVPYVFASATALLAGGLSAFGIFASIESFPVAFLASCFVGIVVDTVVFLLIYTDSLALFPIDFLMKLIIPTVFLLGYAMVKLSHHKT
jgi:hypothetical protein